MPPSALRNVLSQGIPKPRQPLNNLATGLRAPIRPPKLHIQRRANNHNQRTGDHSSVHARLILRRVLAPEDSAADDAADAACPDEGSGAEGALPLAADVVGLPGEDGGDVGVAGADGEEDAEVADADVGYEAQECETCFNLSVSLTLLSTLLTRRPGARWKSAGRRRGERGRGGRNEPRRQSAPLKMMNGDRICHLSPYQANANMTTAASTYGGAIRHCAAATLNPIPSSRMMGRK